MGSVAANVGFVHAFSVQCDHKQGIANNADVQTAIHEGLAGMQLNPSGAAKSGILKVGHNTFEVRIVNNQLDVSFASGNRFTNLFRKETLRSVKCELNAIYKHLVLKPFMEMRSSIADSTVAKIMEKTTPANESRTSVGTPRLSNQQGGLKSATPPHPTPKQSGGFLPLREEVKAKAEAERKAVESFCAAVGIKNPDEVPPAFITAREIQNSNRPATPPHPAPNQFGAIPAPVMMAPTPNQWGLPRATMPQRQTPNQFGAIPAPVMMAPTPNQFGGINRPAMPQHPATNSACEIPNQFIVPPPATNSACEIPNQFIVPPPATK